MRRHAGWDRMRRPRACLAKHAPGRRRGSAWRPIGAARQELADGGRHYSRAATKSAARRSKEDAANKPGLRKLVRVARRAAPRISERGCGHTKTMVAPLGAPSPSSLRGDNGKTGLPGASPNNTGDDAWLFEKLGCLAHWLFENSIRHSFGNVNHVPLIPAQAGIQHFFARTGSPPSRGRAGCWSA